MDQRERSGDLTEALRAALDGRQAKMWTATPGIIQSFDADAQTVVVQPSIQARQSFPDGSVKLVNLPLLLDCPVQFPAGGGVSLTFPLTAGDECLVVLASRCIDAWWQSGGVQAPMEARMHDLSDGFALVGFRSQPRALSGVSTTKAQLRSDDGRAWIELDPTSHEVNITAPGGSTIDANVTIDGTLHVTGQITSDADVVTGSISLKNHVHTGVQAGSDNTGGPSG